MSPGGFFERWPVWRLGGHLVWWLVGILPLVTFSLWACSVALRSRATLSGDNWTGLAAAGAVLTLLELWCWGLGRQKGARELVPCAFLALPLSLIPTLWVAAYRTQPFEWVLVSGTLAAWGSTMALGTVGIFVLRRAEARLIRPAEIEAQADESGD